MILNSSENRSRYWDGYNAEYEDFIPTLIHDEHRPEDCEKGGEDHVGDESRYFFVGAMGVRANVLGGDEAIPRTPTQDPMMIIRQMELPKAFLIMKP